MPSLDAFYYGNPSILQLQLLELSHPNFSQTYRVVRNFGSAQTISVTHEGPAGPFTYTQLPLTIRPAGSGNDLDQVVEITFGDLGEILPKELDAIAHANAFSTKPKAIYREYQSDDLTAPLGSPLTLEVTSLAFNKTGAVIKAKAAAFNQGRVGVYYTRDLFPMLQNA